MYLRKKLLSLALTFSIIFSAYADGGMYPVSMLDKVPLKKAGLKIPVNQIYDPNGQGLLQAVVQIGGCTGSFVSGQGLILTNHHCAFGTLQPYSTPENNLLDKGYLAENRQKELPIKNMTCKILESHKDVSADILKGTENVTDATTKKTLITSNIEKIKKEESDKNKDLVIEISEMLPGKNYILFRYKVLRDLRIVFIPARNIGEFGGETDNWVWPRHTGDFSFIRAYVSKTGQTTTYDAGNIPYEPKEYLNVNGNGVEEGDFVFILGYPGRTYRNQPTEFVGQHLRWQLPYISNLYTWQIKTMKQIGKTNEAWFIRMQPRIKSLANVEKNYQGKIKSLNGLDLYEKRKTEEKELAAKLKPESRAKYNSTIKSIDSIYGLSEKSFHKYLWYNQIMNNSTILRLAEVLNHFNAAYKDASKNASELEKLRAETITNYRSILNSMYLPWDTTYLGKMLFDAYAFKDGNSVKPIDDIFSENCTQNTVYQYIRAALKKSDLLDSNFIYKLINKNPKKLAKLNDPFMKLSDRLYAEYALLDAEQQNYKTQLDNLLPRYVDYRMEALGQEFIPDANSTMRLTYGYIKGYSPADATYFQPQTTVAGMIEKNGQSDDYNVNEKLAYIWKQKKITPFHSPKLNDVPSGILYNTDTSGGNSGSPVLNKYGQLIGLNFDRAYEATVNDYAWDDAYSRSIGLDIRFVLWTTQEVAGAKYLVDEMFIDKGK